MAQILRGVEQVIEAPVEGLAEAEEPPTLYGMEEQLSAGMASASVCDEGVEAA